MRHAVIELARRALPLMCPHKRAEAERLIAHFERTSNAEEDPLAELKEEIAREWESDLHPVRTAIAAALHGESAEAIFALKQLLPGLLREVNEAPRFVRALAAAMTSAFHGALTDPHRTGNSEALGHLRRKQIFETDLGSADLRMFSQELKNRSLFVARCTNAEFLEEVKQVCDDILSGKINQATGRLRLLKKLKELGYDPAIGFPGDMADVPPAEKGSLQDLSSTQRLDLIIETQVRLAAGYAQQRAGNTPYALREYPAWELVRLYHRDVPRGSPESKSPGWEQRWHDAGESVGWEGAVQDERIALKDSPLWQALGDGAGGRTDSLGNPFPPFAFRSGMAWKPVARERCIELRLISGDETPAATPGTLTPGQKEVNDVFKRLSPELQAEIRRELGL